MKPLFLQYLFAVAKYALHCRHTDKYVITCAISVSDTVAARKVCHISTCRVSSRFQKPSCRITDMSHLRVKSWGLRRRHSLLAENINILIDLYYTVPKRTYKIWGTINRPTLIILRVSLKGVIDLDYLFYMQ